MGLTVTDFDTNKVNEADATTEQNDHLKHKSGEDIVGAMVDKQSSSSFSSEPIFEVGNEDIKGYMNYKIYDQHTGHVISQQPDDDQLDIQSEGGQTVENYTIQESGKHYASGKTYYLGFKTVAVPVKDDSNSSS